MQHFTSDGVFLGEFDSPGDGSGTFNNVGRVAWDPNGFVVVPEQGDDLIHVVRPDGTHVVTWGGFGSGPGQFHFPTCADIDGNGNLFILDKDNGRVQRFAPIETSAHGTTFGGLKARYRR